MRFFRWFHRNAEVSAEWKFTTTSGSPGPPRPTVPQAHELTSSLVTAWRYPSFRRLSAMMRSRSAFSAPSYT